MSWGFTYNGVHSDTLGIRVKNIKGRGFLPEIESKLMETSTMHGAHYYGFRYKPRPITLEVSVYADSLEEFRLKFREIANFLNPKGGPKSIIFDDEQELQYFAVLTGLPDPDEVYTKRTFEITLLCPDPFLYALTETANSFTSDSSSIFNQANEECFPVFTVVFSSETSSLKIEKNVDEYVNINRSFSASDEVVVDCNTGKITLNGSVNLLPTLDIDSNFFSLDPGQNTINISPLSSASTIVSFVERWNA